MKPNDRRVILSNGEQYVTSITKKHGFGETTPPRPYEEARLMVKEQINLALTRVLALPREKKLTDESILCLRLHPDVTAKTYNPEEIFKLIPQLENVGSRNYKANPANVARTKKMRDLIERSIEETTGRMVFVRGSDAGYQKLLRTLDQSENALSKKFVHEIQRIERFDTLRPTEQIDGFERGWNEGRVEIVFHPTKISKDEQLNFIQTLFGNTESDVLRPRFAYYEGGPMFVSCYINKTVLSALAGSNPLRTVHPMRFDGFADVRSEPLFKAPAPSIVNTRSTIKVGMFDGGINPLHPHLIGHVEEDTNLSIKTPADPRGVAHGTAVAGVLLHGPLNQFEAGDVLPQPKVSVVSIRTLPTSNRSDIDLYESIDVIEKTVPARPDIKCYNISFGPRGPILDDRISRFTFVLDDLAHKHKVTFCVAVGNDGEGGPVMNRIQTPADLVNGLGVGAYTHDDQGIVHAGYSCQGPGRECGKIKPDLVAYGGCANRPIHLLSGDAGIKAISAGTSFASPTIASLGAQCADGFERGTPLLSRVILLHSASHPKKVPDHFLGHGAVSSSIDDLLHCEASSVTILFEGYIPPAKYVKLPLLLPPNIITNGLIDLKWTVTALPQVNVNHPADYTSMCIEDTFYPNSQVYSYKSPGDKRTIKLLHETDDAHQIKDLLSKGWVKSSMPHSDTPKVSTEEELRADYKWDTSVKRTKRKNAKGLHEPFLVLHAISRHGNPQKLQYAAAVTITAKAFLGNLYESIIRNYAALRPVRIRTNAELRVKI